MKYILLVLAFLAMTSISAITIASNASADIDVGNGQRVFTESSYGFSISNVIGTITPNDGQKIHIVKIGIGGDADYASGDSMFRITGGGLDFTWVAGQQTNAATHRLAATTRSGSIAGFTYVNVDYTATLNSALQVSWIMQNDWDGLYMSGTDIFGNSYNDTSSTVRAWVQYELIQIVPEPSAFILVGFAFFGFFFLPRKK